MRFREWQHQRDVSEQQTPAGSGQRVLLRERYWEFRHWIWETWQSMPDWPIYARVLAGMLPIALITGTGFGVAKLLKSPVKPKRDAFVQLLLRDAVREAPVGAKRVLVVGDLTAYALIAAINGVYDGDGVRGIAFGQFGCGISDAAPVVFGRTQPIRPACTTWRTDYATFAETYRPVATLLVVGSRESLDQTLNGRSLKARSPELAKYLTQQLDESSKIIASRGSLVFLSTVMTCTADKSLVNLAWVNNVWRDYAKQSTNNVQLADLDAEMCRNGKPIVDNGRATFDTTGLTENGARHIWKWFAKLALAPPAKTRP